jgi:type II secretory pathway pseudopilin PulG
VGQNERQFIREKDEDTLFMPSLVPELKKFSDHARLKVKSDLLNTLLNAQQHYSTSASFTSSQIGFVQNYATRGQYHDPAHRGTIQGNTGGQTRLTNQLPAVCSPTVSEYSDESLLYSPAAHEEQR